MRLLNTSTPSRPKLESFNENEIPPYAILSHTWGTDEVSFHDIQSSDFADKGGFAKLQFACTEARKRGWDYVWVDTCCIDKTSSAELSEAINSMFNWYQDAKECYVYLSDVETEILGEDGSLSTPITKSRWFTRGWTLQELLAPKEVLFYSKEGHFLGTKITLSQEIFLPTKIEEFYLVEPSRIFSASVSRRMSWASARVTTRTEDLAYCLMGMFRINMPMLYGEGERAFLRLQEEIMRTTDDQTLLAWQTPGSHFGGFTSRSATEDCRLFALSPKDFQKSADYIPDELTTHQDPFFRTNKGLNITVSVDLEPELSDVIAVLACRSRHNAFHLVGIYIELIGGDIGYRRNSSVTFIGRDEVNSLPRKCLRLLNSGPRHHHIAHNFNLWIQRKIQILIRRLPQKVNYAWDITVEPAANWLQRERMISGPAADENQNFHLAGIYIRVSYQVSWVVILTPMRSLRREWNFARVVRCDGAEPRALSYYLSDTSSADGGGTREGESRIKATLSELPLLMADGQYVYTLDLDFEK